MKQVKLTIYIDGPIVIKPERQLREGVHQKIGEVAKMTAVYELYVNDDDGMQLYKFLEGRLTSEYSFTWQIGDNKLLRVLPNGIAGFDIKDVPGIDGESTPVKVRVCQGTKQIFAADAECVQRGSR